MIYCFLCLISRHRKHSRLCILNLKHLFWSYHHFDKMYLPALLPPDHNQLKAQISLYYVFYYLIYPQYLIYSSFWVHFFLWLLLLGICCGVVGCTILLRFFHRASHGGDSLVETGHRLREVKRGWEIVNRVGSAV